MEEKKITQVVREKYADIAKEGSSCCCGCSCTDGITYAKSLGYSEEELSKIPVDANLSLSCGNPTALATLKEGEVVLDLGSGAGFDCFLAAGKVGSTGRVIGVDMTSEMIEKARTIAERDNIKNVEFRLGEIENLPVADNSINAVISNCVINLSSDKEKVFKEIFRVLKPRGRVLISDVALLKELPTDIKSNIEAYVGCIAGALPIEHYEDIVKKAGLISVNITISDNSFGKEIDTTDPIAKHIIDSLEPGMTMADYVASIYLKAVKDDR